MPSKQEAAKKSPVKKISKVFSNDLKMCCKTFCCECDKVVTLSGMRKHVKTWHQMTFTEYKELYGNPRMQIIQLVHHKCAVCQTKLLFDTEDVSKHVKKKHQISYREYTALYLGKPRPKGPPNNPQGKVQDDSMEKTCDSSLIVIRCDQCPRTFKQNIQLKIHKRNHSI